MFGWLKRLVQGGRRADGGAEHRRLVQLARGDMARVERLVAVEMRKDPALSRAQAIRNAVDRLEYELSR